MSDTFCQEYLDRFDPSGTYDCSCGRRHIMVSRGVWLGPGALARVGEQARDAMGPSVRVWTLSDENTWAAAGEACLDALGGLAVGGSVLPARPRPTTTVDLAERLSREAGASRPGLVVAIGGGTISDLGKMISLNLGVPNWCVATAPSADAYGSGNVAAKFPYRAQSVPGTPSEHIICDLDVLERAPRELFLSGLGDLLAKFLAFLDWNVSAVVTEEYYCSEAADLALESARRAIEAAALQGTDSAAAVRSLTDALLTSSFAMQAVGYSRPAATAEHTICHYWEVSHAPANEQRRLHGLLVGLASRILLCGYSAFYRDLPVPKGGESEVGQRRTAASRAPDWDTDLHPAMKPLRRWIAEEAEPELYAPETVAAHLVRYRDHREAIAALAAEALEELGRGVLVLSQAGYPFRLADYGLSVEQTLLPFRYVRALRRRYSSFNLMHELGREAETLEVIGREIKGLD